MASTDRTTSGTDGSVVAKLSFLDRFLAVWILLAMAVGLGLGRLVPGLNELLAAMEVGGISLPIAHSHPLSPHFYWRCRRHVYVAASLSQRPGIRNRPRVTR